MENSAWRDHVFLEATGLPNSYVTSIILGSVNVAATFIALWVVAHCGRRKCLMAGAAWMCICLFIFAFIGHYKLPNVDGTNNAQAGQVMIVFTCLFIVAFAITWGPLAWAIVGELYPARYRATAIGLAAASVRKPLPHAGEVQEANMDPPPRTGW